MVEGENLYNDLKRSDLVYIETLKGKPKEQLIEPHKTSYLLRKKSALKHLKIFTKNELIYLYSESDGYYEDLKVSELEMLVFSLLVKTVGHDLVSSKYVKTVVSTMKMDSSISFKGDPLFDSDFYVFTNGTLDLTTNESVSWGPEVFTTSSAPFSYDKAATCPRFMDFLQTFTNGDKGREIVIRSFTKVLLMSKVTVQKFMYIVGQAATGKSQLALLFTALVGKRATVTTGLKALHSDAFEVDNLRNKRLILVSEAGKYQGELETLKKITGNDALAGRKKFLQGSSEVVVEGMVVMVSNVEFSIYDPTGSIPRRIVIIRADNVSEERDPLIQFTKKKWVGPLADELPGIFNWAHSMSLEDAIYNLKNLDKIDSTSEISQDHYDMTIIFDSVQEWVNDELEAGAGSYLGFFNTSNTAKDRLDLARRRTLFPTYIRWCKRRNIPISTNHREFGESVIKALRQTEFGKHCRSEKNTKGIYITGGQVRSDVYNLDNELGGPIIFEEEEEEEISNVEGFIVEESKHNTSIAQDYTKNINNTSAIPSKSDSYVERLENVLDKYVEDVDDILDHFVEETEEELDPFVEEAEEEEGDVLIESKDHNDKELKEKANDDSWEAKYPELYKKRVPQDPDEEPEYPKRT